MNLSTGCHYHAIRNIGRDTKFTVFLYVCMYGYRFLSRSFTDRREILHGDSATSQTVGDSLQGWPSFRRQQGAIWRDMLLVKHSLVCSKATVSFPAKEHHLPLAGSKLYCLLTCLRSLQSSMQHGDEATSCQSWVWQRTILTVPWCHTQCALHAVAGVSDVHPALTSYKTGHCCWWLMYQCNRLPGKTYPLTDH